MAEKALYFLSILFKSAFGILCQIASIVGLIVVFIKQSWAIYVALFFVCISLISFIVAFVYFVSKRFGEKYPEGFKRIASFCFYKTEDGTNITCTTKRIIQCKSLCLPEIEHKFKWTGRSVPNFSAGKHEVVSNTVTTGSGDYDFDVTKIRLACPLLYDETETINVKAVVNDADHVSKPFLGHIVKNPVGHLVFSILLGYKPDGFSKPAGLFRKKIGCDIDPAFELIEEIPFDVKHKRYYTEMDNPDVGYLYKIEWER